LAATILARRKNYYEVLEASNKQNEITNWLMWFASVAIEAMRRTIATVEFLIDKTKMWDRLKGPLNDRQEKALLRMFREGPEARRAYRRKIRPHHWGVTSDDDTGPRGSGCQRRVREGEHRYPRYRLSVPING
jgi:hypothetical protein